jgi:hypothetical protein
MSNTVLFLSTHDTSRGPMAAALFNRIADPAVVQATSAGWRPGWAVPPFIVHALREMRGIDLAAYEPRMVQPKEVRRATLLVNIGVGDQFFDVGVPCMRWAVSLFGGRTADEVGRVCGDIEARVLRLCASRSWLRTGPFPTRAVPLRV